MVRFHPFDRLDQFDPLSQSVLLAQLAQFHRLVLWTQFRPLDRLLLFAPFDQLVQFDPSAQFHLLDQFHPLDRLDLLDPLRQFDQLGLYHLSGQ